MSDDVRRAAVTALGFVLFNTPGQVPPLLALLAESYNPHVRAGVAMAVGIACAGQGDRPQVTKPGAAAAEGEESKVESKVAATTTPSGQGQAESDAVALASANHAGGAALDLLWPLLKDTVDFVRQGALMAAAMVLMQESETSTPRVKALRHRMTSVMVAKTEPKLAKMGAIIGLGLLDAGGRNVVLSLRSRSGLNRRTGIVGAALFCQGWYWFPLLHAVSLAFTPTAMITLNHKLEMPKGFSVTVRTILSFELFLITSGFFQCAAPPSRFAYPEPLKEKVEEKKERVKTAVLSTTAKAKARALRKEREKKLAEGGDAASMDVDASEDAKAEAGGGEQKSDSTPTPVGPEPSSFVLQNPTRVTVKQALLLSVPSQRYEVVSKVRLVISSTTLSHLTFQI